MISPYTSTYLHVGGGPVHVADFGGEGRPVVLVHGLGGSHANWVSVAAGLRQLGKVTAPDLPGFGLSPARRHASLEDHRRVLAGYLETLDGPALLVGNSMGAALSILQAAGQPATVSGLVLISPASPPTLGFWPDAEITTLFSLYLVPGFARAAMAARRKRMRPEEVAEWTLDLCSARASRIPPDVFDLHVEVARRRLHMPGIDRATVATGHSLMRLLTARSSYDRVVAAVTAPTLVIQGREDRLVRYQSALRLAAIRPDWDLRLLDDVGHVAMLEVPVTVSRLVASWASTRAAA